MPVARIDVVPDDLNIKFKIRQSDGFRKSGINLPLYRMVIRATRIVELLLRI